MIHVSTTPFYRLTALLCLGRVIAARFPAVGAECQRKCGGVEIPYPFGVGARGSGCAMPGFELICSDTGNGEQKPFHKGSELLSISLLQAQVRMSMGITSSCYDDISKKMDNNIRNLDLAQTPYRFSGTGNKFTVIGCQTLAYISSNYDVSNGNLMTGCLATCREADLASLTDGTCSGIGCCQTAIPKGLQNYTVWFGPRFNTSDIYKMSRCSYAALVEASSFTFSSSYANSSAFIDTHGGKAPLLVDWAIGNETCEEARKEPESYACVSSNSECIDSRNGPGYICNCTKGFQGNPYLKGPDGCGDIDECLRPNSCEGTCHNTIGSFICCPDSTEFDPGKMQCTSTKHRNIIIGVTLGLSVGFGMLLVSFTGIFHFKRWNRGIKRKQRRKYFQKNQGLLLEQLILSDRNASDTTKIFSLEEMEKATNNFDETRILGRGGHGVVYKGILSDQRVVAIKKSKFIEKGEIDQFINEVAILSQINHRNIVRLFGCCLETEVPLLVYDFVSNGSLFQILHRANSGFSISWYDCLRIASEAAGALYYLHSSASVAVFHRDVKSSNILLDGNYIAKVSDFGASRLIPIDQTHIVTNVQGTFGYLDPEYYHTGQLNDKSDVYSFGVVLVELLLRKESVFADESGLKQNLSNFFVQEAKVRPITEIVAPQVLEEATEEEINSVACLAEVCLRLRGEERPTMKQVEMTLQSLRDKRFKVRQVTGRNDEENQPLLTTRAIYRSLGVELGNSSSTSASQRSGNCYSMQQEFISSASLPR